MLSLFTRYSRGYLRRHFHSLRLDTTGWIPDPLDDSPKVVYLNHASWWDPLVCLQARHRFFPDHTAYAPIEDAAVARYAFFRRLGFFGVKPDSRSGAARFLRIAESITRRPRAMLWITPQGRFADVRDRPIELKPGLAHLAARLAREDRSRPPGSRTVRFIPLAIEYTFWEERLPEILLRFGEPVAIPTTSGAAMESPGAWANELSTRLESTLDLLAAGSRHRDVHRFTPLLEGRQGVGMAYDLWRRTKALLQGRTFQPRHGNL
jgi:1-acyl-sn-glycerol-3-phosphate acyltransferase